MPELPLAVWIALAAVLGLLVGSFLNVVILRLPERMTASWRREAREVLELPADDAPLPPGIVREPSHCPHCKHPLSAADNIPLFGWLLLRGRCRYCKAKISIQYPLVELFSGVLSALVVWKFGPSWTALAGLVFTWVLIGFSCVLAFAVVYNTARIALSERGRELASLRVLGFTHAEVTGMLLGEQAILTFLSIPVGYALGYGVCALMSRAYQWELFRMPLIVKAETYVFAVVTVLTAALCTGWLVRRRLQHLDLVEVLKTRE